jgi:hypothetical protein
MRLQPIFLKKKLYHLQLSKQSPNTYNHCLLWQEGDNTSLYSCCGLIISFSIMYKLAAILDARNHISLHISFHCGPLRLLLFCGLLPLLKSKLDEVFGGPGGEDQGLSGIA